MKYSDIDKRKTAFIFELDNVLYPEKDYLFQVYYLFAGLLEYIELIEAKKTTDILIDAYTADGKGAAFDHLKEKLNVDEKYRSKLEQLMQTAKLPLKLLLYQKMLTLLQEIVIDRKKIFIVTNGNPGQQLNKIKQAEWHGLEKYLIAYFANETAPKPETDVIDKLIEEHNLQRRHMIIIGSSVEDEECSTNCGIDYISAKEFL